MKISKVIELLKDKARQIYAEKKENYQFRASSYIRAADYIKNNYDDVQATQKLVSSMNLTPYMKAKILSLKADKANSAKEDPKLKLKKQLMQIKGLGPEKAAALISKGLKSTTQLKTKKWLAELTEETRQHILNTPEPIPHEEIKKIEAKFKKLAARLKYNIVFVGSYRRKKPISNDIDVMLVSKNTNALSSFLEDIKQIVAIHPYSMGPDKLSTVIEVKDKKYKLDVFRVSPEEEVSMLLYSTGSKENNVAMRAKAKKLGYILNQKGLFDKKTGKKIKLGTEADYYAALQMSYLKPHER